ncbi:hypothetical protein CCAX7_008000 [Capsulimonas corticalis]|uniref:Uncharacterized protein n=1 Tax=Capsulimonas corticalis TaxID=2219043 RepID=A0A402CTU4_9BACT|nr:hypothetical protein [Capsulimonas corticalis]BDI28749.1 hypothetical protein CCAX7_008000 [Capsulimonas corticalis]
MQFRNLPCLTVLACLLVGAEAHGDAAPDKALTQTIDGVTVAIDHVDWGGSPGEDGRCVRNLGIGYSITTDPAATFPQGGGPTDYLHTVNACDPDGARFYSSDGNSRYSATTGSVYFADVNAAWPYITVNLDYTDPGSPATALGKSQGLIEIGSIPLPTQPADSIDTNAEGKSPLGTTVRVTHVQYSRAPNPPAMILTVKVIPDPTAPDLRFVCWEQIKAVADTGAALDAATAQVQPPATSARDFTVTIPALPPAEAKSLSVTLNATESSNMVVPEKSLRHFHFQIPVSSMPPARRWDRSPLQTASGKNVEVTWEYTDAGGKSSPYATAHFRLRDRSDPSTQWTITSVTGTNDQRAPVNGVATGVSTYPPNAFQQDKLWLVDGAPISDGDITRFVLLGGETDKTKDPAIAEFPPSKTVTLTVTAHAIKQILHRMDFPDLPIPKDGQSVTVNKMVIDKTGDWLEVCKIVAFDQDHPLPDIVGRPANLEKPLCGVALMCAEPFDPKRPGRRFDYWPYSCVDSLGRHMDNDLGLPFVQADPMHLMDPKLNRTRPRKRTFLIPLKDIASDTFDLRMERFETIDLPGQEDVTFTNVPVPGGSTP